MKPSQRKFYRNTRSNVCKPVVEDVFGPQQRFPIQTQTNKPTINRCCYVNPQQRDVALGTETNQEQYEELLIGQYGFNSRIPETIDQLKELRKAFCDRSANKVDNSSQYETALPEGTNYVVNPLPDFVETSKESQWLDVETTEDVEKYISEKPTLDGFELPPLPSPVSSPKTVHISRTPKIKTLVQKFSKVKRNDLEVRQLDEKIVCIEYDVYDQAHSNLGDPIQKMRAFFSIKPTQEIKVGDSEPKTVLNLTSNFRKKINIKEALDAKSVHKEIEIIDGNLTVNRSCLDDLRKVLKKKEAMYAKKKRSTLDVQSLYNMARRTKNPSDPDFSNTNLLSEAVLEEIKKAILAKPTSSMQGIRRRSVKKQKERSEHKRNGAVSSCIVAELLKETQDST